MLTIALLLSQLYPYQSPYPHSGASAPAYQQSCQANNFGTPLSCTLGSAVSTGQLIFVHAGTTSTTSTLTFTDNCNTGGTSDTFVQDAAQGTGTSLAGHFVVGLGRSSCQITVAYTGGAATGLNLVASAMTGASAMDVVVSPFNVQAIPGTGTNAVTSGAVTTTAKDLCFGGSLDQSAQAGTIAVGTNIAWTLAAKYTAGNANYSIIDEYFQQSAAGSITADFTFGGSFTTTDTTIVCFKP